MAAISDLGAKPVEAPAVDFGKAVNSQSGFLELAQTFEDTGVSAYNGAGPMLKSKELLGVAGSIAQVEARHAASDSVAQWRQPGSGPVRSEPDHGRGAEGSAALRQVHERSNVMPNVGPMERECKDSISGKDTPQPELESGSRSASRDRRDRSNLLTGRAIRPAAKTRRAGAVPAETVWE